MAGIRSPAVAGMFYPADPDQLRKYVISAVSEAAREVPGVAPVKAVIAPHAGYVYSGHVAARAFAALGENTDIRRIVLLGPAHTVRLAGIAAPAWDGFATPLGIVPVDTAARERIASLAHVMIDNAPHAREHSLEVELPFLQVLFPDAPVLPLVVGEASPEEVSQAMEILWEEGTVFIVSSDLSHYEPYETARRHDAGTAERIAKLDYSHITPMDACGARPLAGLLLQARRHGLRPELLDLRNSGDTAGSRDRVVGYGAWAFHA